MSEIKNPHLSNQQLIELLQCIRVINFKNYPDHFKEIDVPHGHELIDTVIQRLGSQAHNCEMTEVQVDLNSLFTSNYNIEQYIYQNALQMHHAIEARRLAQDIVAHIHREKLIMQESTHRMRLYITAGDNGRAGYKGNGDFTTSWAISVTPNDAI